MKLHFHKCEIRTFLLPCLGDNKIKMHCLKSFVVNQVIVIEKNMAHYYLVLHKEFEDILFVNLQE